MPRYRLVNNERIQFTPEEEALKDEEEKAWADKSAERKLNYIKEIRLQKLKETDYMANSDYTMPSNIKTWRQSLRDIPSNYDSSKYDELLERDDTDGSLKHSVWTKPS